MGTISLDTVLRPLAQTEDLTEGRVAIPGVRLTRIDVQPAVAAYRRMVREAPYDICELAPTTYFIARAHGARFKALPVFLTRRFRHLGLLVRPDAGIEAPTDLEGKKVGVRAYSVTTGVWTRGILQNEYGVDLAKVTWVVDDEEHVQQLTLPENVEHVPEGKSLASMMAAGEIQAGFAENAGLGREGPPQPGWEAKPVPATAAYRELFPDGMERGAAWFRRTGIYPFHGLVVVRDELLDTHPGLARKLFEAFLAAKQGWLERLRSGAAAGKEDAVYRGLARLVGADPLPYGIEENRPTIEALINYAHQQKLIPRRMSVGELFADVGG